MGFESPIILGCLFLDTGKTLIDVASNRLTTQA